jgi:hypothetical protein
MIYRIRGIWNILSSFFFNLSMHMTHYGILFKMFISKNKRKLIYQSPQNNPGYSIAVVYRSQWGSTVDSKLSWDSVCYTHPAPGAMHGTEYICVMW